MCSRPGPRSSSRTKASPSTISVVVAAVRPAASPPPATVLTRKQEMIEAIPVATPAGIAKPAGVEGPVGRRQGEDEGGDPYRQKGGHREVAGEEGEGEAGDRDEHDQGR